MDTYRSSAELYAKRLGKHLAALDGQAGRDGIGTLLDGIGRKLYYWIAASPPYVMYKPPKFPLRNILGEKAG